MRTRPVGAAMFTACLCVFVALLMYLATHLGAVSRLVPLAVAVPTLAILVVQLLVEIRPWLIGGDVARGSVASTDAAPRSPGATLMVLWLLGLMLSVFGLGLSVGCPAFVLAYLRLRAKEPWGISVAVAVATWGLVYLFFGTLLEVPMHAGYLWRWLNL